MVPRKRLGVAGALLLCISLLTGCAIGGDEAAAQPDRNRRLVYIETWDNSDVYARIGQLPLANVDLAIAFAVPTAAGELTPPTIPDGLKAVIGRLDPDAGITLAVGGWGGTDADHQNILEGFAAAARNPDAFAAQLAEVVGQTGTALGRPVTGVDLDWEYPTAAQAQDFAAVANAVKKVLPAARLTAAVPSDHDLSGIQAAIPAVKNSIDGFHVMTYDEHTPFDGPGSSSGPVATEQGVLSAIEQWRSRLTDAGMDANKAALGIPTYCYQYTGVTAAGQPVRGGTQVPFPDVPGQVLQSQPDGSSAGVVDGVWTTCLTPDDARQIAAAAPAGTVLFYWSAEGLTPAYLAIGRSAG